MALPTSAHFTNDAEKLIKRVPVVREMYAPLVLVVPDNRLLAKVAHACTEAEAVAGSEAVVVVMVLVVVDVEAVVPGDAGFLFN